MNNTDIDIKPMQSYKQAMCNLHRNYLETVHLIGLEIDFVYKLDFNVIVLIIITLCKSSEQNYDSKNPNPFFLS